MDDEDRPVGNDSQDDKTPPKASTRNGDSDESCTNIGKSAKEHTTEAESNEKTCKENNDKKTPPYTVHVAIQACEYDVERRDSILPSRRRTIPSRYRDYEDPDYIPDPDDEDYQPTIRNYGSGRGRGRPRKQTAVSDSAREGTGSEKAIMAESGSNGQKQSVSEVDTRVKTEFTPGKRSRQRYIRVRSQTSENDLFKERPYRCLEEGCGQTFITANWLNRHKEKKHQASCTKDAEPKNDKADDTSKNKTECKKTYNCPTCNKRFTLQGNLKTHMRSHTGEKHFCCDLCPKFFSSADSLKRHKLSHLGIKPYECDECMAKFTSNVALREHKLIHRDLKPYQCAVCNRIFRQISVYQRHLLTHKGEMKFRCEVCGRRFMQKIYLRSHMKKHTGERPYKCDLCEKRFAHASDKARHQKTHSGERPYSCSVCQARFTDPSSCRRHMKEHNGALPFACEKCGDKFKRKISLRTHMNRQHGSEVLQQAIMVTTPSGDVSNVDLCMIGDNKLVLLGPNGQQLPVMTQMLYTENSDVKLADEKVVLKDKEADDAMPEGHQIILMTPPMGNKVVVSADIKQEETLSMTTQQIIEEIGSHLGTQEGTLNGAEGQQVQVAYQVIQDDENHHIVEIQYQPVEEMDEGDQNVIYQEDVAGQAIVGQVVAGQAVTKSNGDVDSITGADGKVEADGDVNPISNVSLLSSHSHEHKYAQDIGTCAPLNVEFTESIVLDSESCAKVDGSLTASGTEMAPSAGGVLRQQILENIEDRNESSAGSVHLSPHSVLGTAESQAPERNVMTNISDPLTGEASQDILTSSVTKMYISKPDFGKQEYYNWLSLFNDQCKQMPVPLDEETFRNINQLHKTLTDVMASPSGILAHKDNFRILMSISRDLNNVIDEHLMCIFQTLDDDS